MGTQSPPVAPEPEIEAGVIEDAEAGVIEAGVAEAGVAEAGVIEAGVIEDAEAGVIEDARARQRRQRRAGGVLLATSATVVALILGLTGGGGGSHGGGAGGSPAGSNPGSGPAHTAANTTFPGAPSTQPNGYGVASDMCPLAPANRYLPAHSGCVTVRRADVNGDGRPDLIIVYSRLGRHQLAPYAGEPPSMMHEYKAQAAFLKVVLAGGTSVSVRIKGVEGSRAAAVDAIAHVNADPGDEIFLEVGRISSGATGVAYGFHDGRLVPAGVKLYYNGDSGVEAGFNCVSGHPPRLIQRVFLFEGPNEFTRSWKETEWVYAWHGPKLVQLSRRTFKQLVALKRQAGLHNSETGIGSGCFRGVS